MVRVPVLSELIAEVNPSVSTEGRSFTMALRLARSTAPTDKIHCDTVGSASGMAAMASETALMNSASQAAAPPRRKHHDHREPGRGRYPQREAVELTVQGRLLGGRGGQQPGDLP